MGFTGGRQLLSPRLDERGGAGKLESLATYERNFEWCIELHMSWKIFLAEGLHINTTSL